MSRQKLHRRATVGYWINAMDGQLFCYIEQPVDHGLVVAVRKDIVPCLMANVEMRAEHRERIKVNPQVS